MKAFDDARDSLGIGEQLVNDPAGDVSTRVDALLMLARCEAVAGHSGEARSLVARAWKLADDAGDSRARILAFSAQHFSAGDS